MGNVFVTMYSNPSIAVETASTILVGSLLSMNTGLNPIFAHVIGGVGSEVVAYGTGIAQNMRKKEITVFPVSFLLLAAIMNGTVPYGNE